MDRELSARRAWVVHRPRLDEILSAGLEYPLVEVTAAPGYGKTTAVMDFCRQTERKLFWLHLLPIDNDPERFWSRCCEAMREEMPRLAEDLCRSGFPETLGEFHAHLKNVAKELYADTEVLAVFDCAENVSNPKVRRFVDGMVRAEMENLCLVVISNERQSIGKLVGAGRCFHIGPDELQFTEDETRSLFEHYGVALNDEESADLTQRTGGWPLALHLIASHSAQGARPIYGERSPMRTIVELFEQNYFAGYAPQARRTLVKLSYFEGAAPDLIRAIDGRDLAETIEELAHNAFVFYDYNQGLFYLQKMYSDYLKQKRPLLSESEIRSLCLGAGNWFRANAKFQEALECFWRIPDYERFLSTAAEMPGGRTGAGSTQPALDRLSEMPQDFVQSHPQVDFLRGRLHLSNLKVAKARKTLLSLAERLEGQGPEEKDKLLLGDVYAVLADITLAQNDLGFDEFAERALALLPDGTRIEADEILIVGNCEIFFLPDAAPGRLESMRHAILEFLEPATRLFGDAGKAFCLLFAAEAAYCAAQFGDAMEHVTKAAHTGVLAHRPDIAANALYLRLRLMLYLGDGERAEKALDELVAYIDDNHFSDLCDLRDCALGLFHMQQGNIGKVPPWLAGGAKPVVEIPMDRGRDGTVSAFCKFAAGNCEAAYNALVELDEIFEERPLWPIRLSGIIAKSICLLRMDFHERALVLFRQAYEMSWQNGITVYFAEFGHDVLALVEAAAGQDDHVFDEGWLEKVRASAKAFGKRKAAMLRRYGGANTRTRPKPARLSPRETQVLNYLSQGLTRDEIQTCLGISLHGVKKHITSIYNKLGAVNRVDAIHIAVTSGLIDLGRGTNPERQFVEE